MGLTGKMTTLSEEEDNFIRIFKLVNGIAPAAVREKFNQFFPPASWSSILTREKPKIRNLHRNKRLTNAQMSVLFPTTGMYIAFETF